MKSFLKNMFKSNQQETPELDYTFTIKNIDQAEEGMRPFDDLPWIAIDKNNNIGIFISTGFGDIPMEVFNDKEKYFKSIDLIEQAITEKWHFTYDYDDYVNSKEFGPYKIISKPQCEKELDLKEVTYVRFENILFKETNQLFIKDHFKNRNV